MVWGRADPQMEFVGPGEEKSGAPRPKSGPGRSLIQALQASENRPGRGQASQ